MKIQSPLFLVILVTMLFDHAVGNSMSSGTMSSGSMPTNNSGSMANTSGTMSSGSMPTNNSGSMANTSGTMSSGSMSTSTTTITTSGTTTTGVPGVHEVAFDVNATVSVDTIRVAIANAIGVSASSINHVSDSNPPSLNGGALGDAGRTVVFRFEDSAAANAAIVKANDGTLSSVGVRGAAAVSTPSPDVATDDDNKTTVIIIVVVSVIVFILAVCVAFVAYKKCKCGGYREGDREMKSGAFHLQVPDRELL